MLRGCAANVGPLIGVDLEVGPATLATSEEPPEGELAVLPVSIEFDDRVICALTVSSPLQDIAALARRLLDDDEPDKAREINADELDAIGEVLNLMSGAIDQSVREHINPSYRSKPLTWWRSDDPGNQAFAEGEHTVASGAIQIPSAGAVELTIRIPPKLFSQPQETQSRRKQGQVLLLGLAEELQSSLASILKQAQIAVETAAPGDEELEELLPKTDAIFIAGDDEAGLQLARQLRLAHDSWQIPTILCLSTPTKSRVLRALDEGATYVMAVPADEISVLRVLRAAQPAEG